MKPFLASSTLLSQGMATRAPLLSSIVGFSDFSPNISLWKQPLKILSNKPSVGFFFLVFADMFFVFFGREKCSCRSSAKFVFFDRFENWTWNCDDIVSRCSHVDRCEHAPWCVYGTSGNFWNVCWGGGCLSSLVVDGLRVTHPQVGFANLIGIIAGRRANYSQYLAHDTVSRIFTNAVWISSF